MCILYSTYVVFSIFIVLLTNNPGKKTAALCVLRSARGLAVGVYCPLSILPSSMYFFPSNPPPTNHSTKNNKKQRPNPHQEGGLVEEASQKQRGCRHQRPRFTEDRRDAAHHRDEERHAKQGHHLEEVPKYVQVYGKVQ